MLPVKNRLRGKINFERAKAKGALYQGKKFGLVSFDRKDREPCRVGFIVSTKISKRAVERNKTKRLLKSVFRNNLANIEDGKDILVLAKKSILEENSKSLAKEVQKTLKEARLLK